MAGPLSGLRIIELGGIGPVPFCGMMLADHGAEVIRIDRIGATANLGDPLSRSRRSIALDLKDPRAIAIVRRLLTGADGLIEGFRPGVCERMGLGPDVAASSNPRLVYGRMTGWGQTGPLASVPGHDIDYIAVSGALHGCGPADGPPSVPVNYLGDFGGGGLMLAFAMVSAILSARASGRGQVVDCAMTEGSALLTGMTWGFLNAGEWEDRRGVNILDGAAPFYATYETSDGGSIALGAIEPQFYRALRAGLGLGDEPLFADQYDRSLWPVQKERLRLLFLTGTRAEWCAALEGGDACMAPVLSLREAAAHPHNVERASFVEVGGVVHPAPAPRYSDTVLASPNAPPLTGADAQALLGELGYAKADVERMRHEGFVGGEFPNPA